MARPSILQPLGGPLAGHRLEFSGGDVVIGSAPYCGVQIDAPGVEAQHARIVIDITGATIYRIDGVVGVNDDVVLGDALLRSGDFVWLGEPGGATSLMLQFTLGDVEEPAAAPVAAVRTIEPPSHDVAEEVGAFDLASHAAEVDELVVEEAGLGTPPMEAASDVEMMEMEPETLAHAPVPEAPIEEALVEEPLQEEPLVEEPLMEEELTAQELPSEELVAEEMIEESPLTEELHEMPEAPQGAGVAQMEVGPSDLEPISELEPSFETSMDEMPSAPAPVSSSVVPKAPWQMPSVAEPAAPAEYASAWESAPPAPAPPAAEEAEATMLLTSSPIAPPARPASAPTPAPAPPTPPPPPPAPKRPAPAPAPKMKARTVEQDAVLRTPPPPPPPARTTSSTPMVVGGLAALAVLGIAGFFLLRPAAEPVAPAPTPAPTPVAVSTPVIAETPAVVEPTPVTVAEATPAVATPPVATPVAPAPRATPTPAPRATPTPRTTPTPAAARPGTPAATVAPTVAAPVAPVSQAPRLLEEARAAVAARDYPKAVQALDTLLRLEPGNAEAAARKAEVEARVATLARKFSGGATTVIGGKTAKGPSGFDLGGGGVVKTDFSAQIRCTTTPTSVEAGMAYTVRCSILNIGTKAFKLESVSANETADGAKTAGAGSAPRTDLAPQANAVIFEKSGTWSAKSAWSVEVVAKTTKDESFRTVYNWR